MLKKDLGDLQALRRGEPVMFFGDFDLWTWLGKKRHKTQGWALLGQLIVSYVPATRLQGQLLMLVTGHLWRRNRGERFWAESSVVRGPQNHTGQDEKRAIPCFLTLSIPWNFHPWQQAHIDSHWWWPWHMIPLVITSLSTQSWVQQPHDSPSLPFGMRWHIAGNSQV